MRYCRPTIRRNGSSDPFYVPPDGQLNVKIPTTRMLSPWVLARQMWKLIQDWNDLFRRREITRHYLQLPFGNSTANGHNDQGLQIRTVLQTWINPKSSSAPPIQRNAFGVTSGIPITVTLRSCSSFNGIMSIIGDSTVFSNWQAAAKLRWH